jgi:epoxyqueuosine reductase
MMTAEIRNQEGATKPSMVIEARIRSVAAALGFDTIGFAAAEPTDRTRFLREWVERGFAGEMHYIERRLEERIDPRRVLPSARSLVVVGTLCPVDAEGRTDTDASARGRIARYAGGDDYHDVMLDRLRALEAALPVLAARPIRSRSYVDTGPVSERAAAAAAGLGWIGKNSCLIDPDLGSHLMLGVILTELELEPDAEVSDHCGSCRACLDVCPTDAFAEPYVLDATRCISYTTIETRGTIPASLRAAQGDHVFGCDLCQSVCPWNRSRPKNLPADPLGLRARLEKRPEWLAPTLAWILDLDQEGFARASRKTALRRSGWRGLMRNALVAAGNARDPALVPLVERFARGDDPLLREHAEWALARIEASA